jgi:hypothetical protein
MYRALTPHLASSSPSIPPPLTRTSRVTSPSPGSTTPRQSRPRKYAVLLDGSALFLANRTGGEDRRLDYVGIRDLLKEIIDRQTPDAEIIWTLWTAADPNNPGQTKFLDFLEQRLQWDVRRTRPYEAYTIEPQALFGIAEPEPGKISRLIRFDAQIAFAMGRLADDHSLIMVTDSYALCEPLLKVNDHLAGKTAGKSKVAFFGRALDPRWWAVFRPDSGVDLINLDEHEHRVFQMEKREPRKVDVPSGIRVF